MGELQPYSFAGLIRRAFREHAAHKSIFGLPAKKFYTGATDVDLSVLFHGKRAATPLGPAAGPQTQLAQNIALSWLAGCRILELKTVQIMDELEIPRPCIDMQTVGYNVEWSQELKLEQSLEEYVKAAMLIEIIASSGVIDLPAPERDTIYDMSVGYDLKGIQHPRVRAFLEGMLDCGEIVDRLRQEIPEEYAEFRDLDFRRQVSNTLTLSTFHGCPPDEIEGIIDYLLREYGIHCVIKLNPTLLGKDGVREILHDALGYQEAQVPDEAFQKDTRWDQMVGFVERLKATANELGLGLGVKFTNTLIVKNHREFFPAEEKEMYLSGPPLHVLAIQLVARMREKFGDTIPISFSAGIDRQNFPDSVALGLTPVTVCSDLLKPGGYGRASAYLVDLAKRMRAVGATDIASYTLVGHGQDQAALETLTDVPEGLRDNRGTTQAADQTWKAAGSEWGESWLSATRILNAEKYADDVLNDARYARAQNLRLPKKIGSQLELFDCVTCDKCIPVCPNHANFTFALPPTTIQQVRAHKEESGWRIEEFGALPIEQRHQIANFVDFCNDCGNCDIFCPEDGGPYVIKPRFFSSRESWAESGAGDGFHLATSSDPAGTIVRAAGRFSGSEYFLEAGPSVTTYSGPGFRVTFDPDDLPDSLSGDADDAVDFTYCRILEVLQRTILDDAQVNYVNGMG